MNKLTPIVFAVMVIMGGCTKAPLYTLPPGESFPFENNHLKMAIVSTSVPSPQVKDIYFFNENTGVIITNDAKIYKTHDKGISWSLNYSNATSNRELASLVFIDQDVGYAVGTDKNCEVPGCPPPGGFVLKTTDGGETWGTVYQEPGDIEFDDIAVNHTGELFLITNSTRGPAEHTGKIMKSTDAGSNWTTVDTTNFPLSQITFNNNFGFCTGGYEEGKIIRSDDNGNTWAHTVSCGEYWTYDIAFTNNIGYCIADNLSVYKTNDNGDNWTQAYHSNDYSIYRLNALNDNTCLLWGSGAYTGGCFGYSYGAVRQTLNAGADWSEDQFKDIGGIRYTSFYSATDGYFIGSGAGGVNLVKVTINE